jgi:hypothetical protein
MSTQTIIMFPYSGYEVGTQREKVFWEIVRCCWDVVSDRPPIVVLNRDTERRGKAAAFLKATEGKRAAKTGRVLIHRAWSVDTCQMWLSAWGKVIDDPATQDDDRIVQLPGDIETISAGDDNRESFFDNLGTFIDISRWDIIIGDFSSGDMFNAKELIDWYGTYALMANWFPDVAQRIRLMSLNKPRSEFLNMRVKTLKDLLDYRKFAYEQTLNMLIHSWDFERMAWKYRIKAEKLGVLKDDSSFRQYRDCLDQIERTERMLKLLWREIYDPRLQPEEFIERYDRLDRRSTSIRENARIIIRNLLGLGSNHETREVKSNRRRRAQ